MSRNLCSLMKIFDKISVEKCSYCFLCFRTDSESKLKAPQPNLKATTSLSKNGDINNKPPRICYMCESLAAAAVRFRKATFFATSIDMLFKNMLKSDAYQDDVRRVLAKKKPLHSKVIRQHKNLLLEEQELNMFRKSTQLQHTDVVIIDTNDVFTKEPYTDVQTFTNVTNSTTFTTEVIDNDVMEVHVDDNAGEPEIITGDLPSNEIIILDDDAPPPKIKTIDKSLQSFSRTKNNPSILKKHLSKTTHKIDKSQPTLVPIERLLKEPTKNILHNQEKIQKNMVIEPVLTLNNILPNSDPVVPKKATIGYLHPIYQAPDGTHNVPTLSAQIVDGKLMFMGTTQDNKREPPKPLVIENNTIIVPTPDLSNMEADDDINEVVDKMLVDKIEVLKNKKLEQVMVDNENKVVKEPVMKTDRIDWEDKIPMDVISFMDATDPHPPSYIHPLMPAGKISNVRSLQPKLNEVIDLC